jgi:hypothetical protein
MRVLPQLHVPRRDAAMTMRPARQCSQSGAQTAFINIISGAVDLRVKPGGNPYCDACLSPLLAGGRDTGQACATTVDDHKGMVSTLLCKDTDSSR